MRFLLSFFGVFLYSFSAMALSCLPIEMTAEEIEKTEAIFIGKAVAALEEVKDQSQEHDMSQKQAFNLKVLKAWKGVEVGQTVKVWRGTYWGDGYQIGTDYVIGAKKDKAGEYFAPLCGLSHYYPTKEQIEKQNYVFHGQKQLTQIESYFK